MADIILVPSDGDIGNFLSSPLTHSFDDVTLSFINALSKRLLEECRTSYPDLYTLAYWFRTAHIQEMKAQFLGRNSGFLIRPMGTLFQISPGNVDTLFLYSGLLGLLMGNRVAIRISSKQTDQVNYLLTVINRLLEEERFSVIKKRIFIFSSGHESKLIKDLSANCDMRVLWGGDESISAIRKLALSARAKEISFSERVSCCLISAEEVIKTEDISPLVSMFVKDITSFSQQACSSPKCLIWQGSKDLVTKAKEKFWLSVDTYLENTNFDSSISELMAKKVSLQKMAVMYPIKAIEEYKVISRADIDINLIDMPLLKLIAGHGLLIQSEIADLTCFSSHLSEHYQTLSYWGYQRDKLLKKIANTDGLLLNFDRIEPIGHALEFNYIWDGYDLLHEYCKLFKE